MTIERRLADFLIASRPADAARVLERLPADQVASVLALTAEPAAVAVFEWMEPALAAEALSAGAEERMAAVLETLPVDAAARLFGRMGPADRERLAARLDAQRVRRFTRAIESAEDSAARLMDPTVPVMRDDLPVAEALERVRERPRHVTHYLYLTDPNHRLSGVVGLRELMLAPSTERLGVIARRPVERLRVRDDRATILAHPGWRRFPSLPVVDGDDVPVGVLRYETLRRLEADAGSDRPADLVAFGVTLGRAWAEMATTLLDGFAASLAAARERGERSPEEKTP